MLDRKKMLRIAGLCGIAAPVVAFSLIFLAISLSPWFSWTANALSDLGVGEADFVFNSGLIAGGILTMVFAAGLLTIFRGRPLGRVGAALLFMDAIALLGIGVFSEAAGDIHSYFSVAFFVLFPISLFLLGAGAVMVGSKRFGSFTIVDGVLAALPWAFGWDGVAIPEAISALVASIWIMAEGARLYLGHEKR
ncbi:MAG: hypothetical protein CEE41_01765 [Hadesarchaea archaeon B3_Hades]|nr:MAG: hypothetical protein CEE41_01765 [Hadesarchaea archaeon B3_Hades]